MKQFFRYAGFVLVCSLFILPEFVHAQATTTSEGSTESRSVRQERIRGYRRQSSDVQQKINALGPITNPSVTMPILFGVGIKNISPNFGDPRSGGRTHEGEDIMAVKGTPIISPTPAVVLRTGIGEPEGNYVYTANPGGETFVYMHLDRIGEGVTSGAVLTSGALIGYVGNTGNAAGGAAHLHFEIHNTDNVPVDPFPRLTTELSLQEKISYLTTILNQTSDSTALSQFLVTNFRSTFTSAQTANITLPQIIIDALSSIPASSGPISGGTPLPPGDLEYGSSGSVVVTLQTYLIQAATGPAAANLANARATGNFGSITKAVLIEFQVAKGINPANGYYGSATQVFINTHPLISQPIPPNPPVQSIPPPSIPTATSTGTTGGLVLSRDLTVGMTGDDVRALQLFFNTHGYIIAPSGAGSPGNETTMFGSLTRAAVIRFQTDRNISPAVGYVGPLTRASLGSQ